MEPLRLDSAQINSSAWGDIRTYYEDRLQVLREQNDAPLPLDETALLRGRILEIKLLLAAGEARQKPIEFNGQVA